MDTINEWLSVPSVSFTVGLVVTCVFYWIARRDSRREAKELRRLNLMMMNAMEAAGWVKWARDENGDPTGRVIEVPASSKIEASSSVTATLRDARKHEDQETPDP
jgi:hypothetical protein